MLTAYAIERLPIRLMLPVAIVLGLAAAGGERPSASALAADAALAALLVAQFRIWDDLADRERDTIAHPHRVLVEARSVAPAVVFCFVLAAVTITWICIRDGAALPLAALLALNGALAAGYVRRGPRSTIGDHLLLAKYPAIVIVTSGARVWTRPAPVLLAAAAVYLGACIYEAWHDRTSPAAGNRLLVASEAFLLVITLAALSMGGRP